MINLNRIYFFPGTRCNLRCNHCFIPDNFDIDKCTDEVLFFLKEALENERTSVVHIAGGEPTLYPELFSFINSINQSGIKVSIISNGQSLNDRWVEIIKGLDGNEIRFSLYGLDRLTHERFTSGIGSWDRLMDSIHHVVRKGVRTGLNIPITTGVIERFDEYIKFGEQLGITFIKFILLTPPFRRKSLIIHDIPQWNDIIFLLRTKMKFPPLSKIEIFFPDVLGDMRCQLLSCQPPISVMGNGEVYPCCLLVGRTQFLLGNILYQTWDDIKAELPRLYNKESTLPCIQKEFPTPSFCPIHWETVTLLESSRRENNQLLLSKTGKYS